ncbi:MAG: phosphotransferase family protein, partial [Stackebrandtia sp.]
SSDLAGWTTVVAESMPGASIRQVCRLGGGAAAETFAIDTTDGDVIVKRYPRRRNGTVQFEWERLRFAQRVGIPVPRPLALDTDGRWFGMPAYSMTRLTGHPDVHPRDVAGWLQQLAYALVAIHHTDTTGATGPLLRPPAVQTWRPPKLRQPNALADRTVAAIQNHLPQVSWRPVLIHGDFHPGNTLWNHSRLTGIADWSNSRLGPRSCDLAYCRADVALLLDRAAADQLTHHYTVITGTTPADLPVFDLIWGLDVLRKGVRIRRAHRQLGRADNTQQYTARATAFLLHALAELGAP